MGLWNQRRISSGILSILIFGFIPGASAQNKDIALDRENHETFSQRWELEPRYNRGTFVVTPYKPVFVTAGRWSSYPNDKPTSENPEYSLPNATHYDNFEANFQLSLKTKLLHNILWGHADLWLGYTQKAFWQVYNLKFSRPFRESNYEPELILNFPVHFSLFGFEAKMVGVEMVHQSNGRTLPLSRSWNRVVGYAAFEKQEWRVTLRGWYRLPDDDDENPAICDYAGRGQAIIVYNYKRSQFSADITSGLRPNYPGRGRIQLSWDFPVVGNMRGGLLVSTGYAESMVDYNHHQTTVGLALSLLEW